MPYQTVDTCLGCQYLDAGSARLLAQGVLLSTALLEKGQHCHFLGLQSGHYRPIVKHVMWQRHSEERVVEVGIEHRWMHIALTADRSGIAKTLRHLINGLHHVLLRLCLGCRRPIGPESISGQYRASPGTHIFCRKILASDET